MTQFYSGTFEYEVLKRLDKIEKVMNRRFDAVQSHLGMSDTVIAGDFKQLLAEVANVQGTEDSTATMLKQLSDFIQSHANDPAALMQVKEQLDANREKLVAAVEANKLPPSTPET